MCRSRATARSSFYKTEQIGTDQKYPEKYKTSPHYDGKLMHAIISFVNAI